MELTYESGVWVAILISLVKVVMTTAQFTSIRSKNFRQVGLISGIRGRTSTESGNFNTACLY
jgi:hypothetical protein